jgi:DNA-binding GntR family transcriptional regulator
MSQSTLTQRAYLHLHEGIVSGKLAPGTVVSEIQLAKELGVSRTPVGEAIRQLANEGLVHQVPRYGTIVRAIEPRDIEELYEMREALESFAAAKAARRITALQLAQLEVLCSSIETISEDFPGDAKTRLDLPTLQSFLAADLTFHLLIVKAAGNQRILNTIQETRTMSQIFRMRRHEPDKYTVERASQMHRKILRALASGDAAEASLQMAEHIRASREDTLAYLAKEQQRSDADLASILELPDEVRLELTRIEDDGLREKID